MALVILPALDQNFGVIKVKEGNSDVCLNVIRSSYKNYFKRQFNLIRENYFHLCHNP